MAKYKFLYKPAFFIFSLLFASWLVLEIEQISPSDFGKYEYLFSTKPKTGLLAEDKKKQLIEIILQYKKGIIDSAQLNFKLEKLFSGAGSVTKPPKKN